MKLSITIFLLFSFQIMFSQNPIGSAAKKAERRVTNKIVEKTANGIFNKIFGSDTTNVTKDKSVKTDSSVTANSEPFGGIFSAKKVDKKYSFDVTLDMVLTTKDKKGKGDPIEMKMHYNRDSAFIGSEVESAFNIMDYSSMRNYTIIGGNVTTMNLQKVIDKANRRNKKEEDQEDFTYRKTGKTETIAGYVCEEYEIESEDVKGNYWLTDDIGINISTYQKTFATNPSVTYPKDAQGIILKMVMEDKKDKTVTTLVTNEVIKQTLTYDLSKYKVTDLSRLGF